MVPSPYNPARAIARDFVDACKKAGNVQPNFSAMEGFLAAKVFAEGLKRGGKPTQDALISGLESINEQSFGGFQVNFTSTQHVASRFVELSMLTGDGRVRT